MLRKLILGEGPEQSPKLHKQAMLRGSLALIMMATGAIYVVIDLIYSVTRSLPLYAWIILAGAFALWLNRKRLYRLSTVLILLSGNIIIYLLAASEPSSSGVFVFFFPVSLAALTLFSYADWYWAFGIIMLSLALFFAAYLVDFSFLPQGNYSAEYDRINFIFNFVIAGTASVLIVYFLIQLNYQAEKKLEENENRLLTVAEQLRQSRERFELALQGTRAGIYEWRLKENHVFLSPIWKEMLGYEHDEAIDMSAERLVDMTHPDDREKTQRSIAQHLATVNPITTN